MMYTSIEIDDYGHLTTDDIESLIIIGDLLFASNSMP